ncbi:hypothetical protein HMN09_01263400 [Mycena chlorophos]|uniref:KOW domain-containing protein n=1 Tax=Mycena chlorophos TaxID=658473 RepID=A0A8H6S2X5_MYCCL|nr:hypothetical protein HMN09_01263400 [Mycena chlorophos]
MNWHPPRIAIDELVCREDRHPPARPRPDLREASQRPIKPRSSTPPSPLPMARLSPAPIYGYEPPSTLPVYSWVRLRETDEESGIRAGQLALVVSSDTLITIVPRARLQPGGSPSSSSSSQSHETLAELRVEDGMDLASMVKIASQPGPEDLHRWEQLATETNAKWLQAAYCRDQGAAFVPGCRVALPAGFAGRRRSGFIAEISTDGRAKVRVAIKGAALDPQHPSFVQLLQAPTHEDDVVVFEMSALRRHLFSGIPDVSVGDRAYVVLGAEKGRLGHVVSKESGEDPLVTVALDENRQICVPMRCMIRHFMERDVVKIVHGYHAGEVGTVIRTFPLVETSRKGGLEQLHSALEVFPLNAGEQAGSKGYEIRRVLTQHVVLWDGRETPRPPRKPSEPTKNCPSPTGYSRVLAQRVALWDEDANSARSPGSTYAPSSASDSERMSPLMNRSPPPAVATGPIGNDEGKWLCIPKLAGKRIDVVIMPIRHGRVTNVQADAVHRSGFIELEYPLNEASLKVPLNVYVDGLQKRIRLAPKWLAPMRSALTLPIPPNKDVSIAQAAKGRVVIIGEDVRGNRSQLGEYANIVSGGANDVVLVQFEREWYDPVVQAYYHLQSLCRATNVDGKQTKATRFY